MQRPSPDRPLTAPPTVVALLTCAHIYMDEVSRKASLLGVCNGFQAPAFPAHMPRLFVYLALTDDRGPMELSVRLVDGADLGGTLFSIHLPTARFSSPLQVKEVAVDVPGVAIPRPGLYVRQAACTGAVTRVSCATSSARGA
jgi:hypothetical protein